MKIKNKNILRALVAVVLSACAILLSVWTVMTEQADVNLAVSAGKSSATAHVTQFDTYSNGVLQGTFNNYVSDYGGMFRSYGTATFRNNILSLNRLRVGDRVDFAVGFSDTSSVPSQYRVVMECVNDHYMLYEGLEISIRSQNIPSKDYVCDYVDDVPQIVATDWVKLPQDKKTDTVFVTVKLPESADKYNGCGTQISFSVQVIPCV